MIELLELVTMILGGKQIQTKTKLFEYCQNINENILYDQWVMGIENLVNIILIN